MQDKFTFDVVNILISAAILFVPSAIRLSRIASAV